MSGGRRCWCRDSAPKILSCRARIFLHAPSDSVETRRKRLRVSQPARLIMAWLAPPQRQGPSALAHGSSTLTRCACSTSVRAAWSGRGAKIEFRAQGSMQGLRLHVHRWLSRLVGVPVGAQSNGTALPVEAGAGAQRCVEQAVFVARPPITKQGTTCSMQAHR